MTEAFAKIAPVPKQQRRCSARIARWCAAEKLLCCSRSHGGPVVVLTGWMVVVAQMILLWPHASAEATDQPQTRSRNKFAVVSDGTETLCGIDVLQKNEFQQLRGQRIGLITNHTGLNKEGVSTVTLLHESPHVNLTALFSPEHGFEGRLDVSRIGDSTDRSTGLKIYSLYGQTRRPTPEMLQSVDTLVFDIQDIGTRFYTYISTMGEAMEAAAAAGKRFVVLDRPNPINGCDVAGPMLDAGRESFVAWHRLPIRHGMTTGELATMFQREKKMQLSLTVVPCQNWARCRFWDATNLLWVNPSPNMRCLTQALLYPGIGMIETTNLSVGRGTDTPFEVIGAPWINARKLAAALNAAQLPGTAFVPIRFTPTTSKFANTSCGGVNIIITDRRTFEPLLTGLEICHQLRKLYPDDWRAADALRLLGNKATLQAILDGRPTHELQRLASAGLEEFLLRRQACLLYPEPPSAR